MSRPPPRSQPTGSDDRVLVSNARGQSRIVGDPFAMADPRAGGSGPPTQLNSYGHSVNIRGETSGALLSRQQQSELKSQEAAGMLLDALQKYGPAPGARAMLDWERDAAVNAIEAGVYVTWRSRNKGTDCTRVGPASLCFCGHDYTNHGGVGNAGWKKNKMICDSCPCANFNFIPRRPEECGEWWLPRRKEFDVRTYRAKCKCGHAHTDHDPKNSLHRCRACSGCSAWVSAFLCVVCDFHSEDHDTVWETAAERVAQGKPVGEDYMPFAEAPEIRKLVFDRKPGACEPRPGENARGGPAARKRVTGTGAAAAAPARKAVGAGAGAGVGSASAAASSSSFSAASSSSVSRPSPASRAASSRPAVASASAAAPRGTSARPLADAFAAHSLDDAGDEEEPLPLQRAQPPARQASAATRPPPAAASAVAPRAAAALRAAPRPSAAAAGAAAPTRSAAAAAPPSRAAASSSSSRQQRLELESQLASQAKQSSSAFKPVFD